MRQFVVNNRRMRNQKYREKLREEEGYNEALADLHSQARTSIETSYEFDGVEEEQFGFSNGDYESETGYDAEPDDDTQQHNNLDKIKD